MENTTPTVTAEELKTKDLGSLFQIVFKDWPVAKRESHPAGAYAVPLSQCDTLDTVYGVEKARHLVPYFLSNATTWKGPTARLIKAELNRRLKAK